MREMLHLKGHEPVARNRRRLTFRHPADPRLIIKVWNPAYLEKVRRNFSWRHRFKRYRELAPFLQEVREHIALGAAGNGHPKHLQALTGFVHTDHGFGLVYEAVLQADGSYAPNLRSIVEKHGFTPEAAQALQAFREWLINAPIIVSNLRPEHIVLARDGAGAMHFVMVEGLGDRTSFPINGHVAWLNRRHTRKCLRNFDRRLQVLLARHPQPGT